MQTRHLNLVEDDMDSIPPPIPLRSQTPRRQLAMKASFETQDLGDGMANFDVGLLQQPRSQSQARRYHNNNHDQNHNHNHVQAQAQHQAPPQSPQQPSRSQAATPAPAPAPSSVDSQSIMSYRSRESQPWSQRDRDASSMSSVFVPTHLPALQVKGAGTDRDGLEPLTEEEYDPSSFDLVVPAHAMGKQYTLEAQSELLFSVKHLAVIFDDPMLLQRFTNFLAASRPGSVPLLKYYLDTLKALKAINYANSLTGNLKGLDGFEFTKDPVTDTVNDALWKRANDAFQAMANHDLPAYITHTYIQTVSITIKRRITDQLAPQLRDLSEGLAEVFCLTDPSRPDNPIVFASEEFHRTTQYGMDYVLGRNCRFLQGPKTNPFSVQRIRDKLAAGVDHCETFLNYRRDGSPFMNLLMVSPLYDSRGVVRYHLGAQVDVSGLVTDCSGLESLAALISRENPEHERYPGESSHKKQDEEKEEFVELAEMFDLLELKTVREVGGAFHRTHQQDVRQTDTVPANWNKPRLVFQDDATISRRLSDPILNEAALSSYSGRLSGIYKHYLLVRPYPSLRILFASPSLRVPGMLQSSFLSRIGGSDRVRETLTQAFAGGNGLTAKIRWLSKSDIQTKANTDGSQSAPSNPGRNRWIHCTPLLGSNGAVGVWMVVLIDDESDEAFIRGMRREAPAVQPASRPKSRLELQDDDNMSLSSFAAAHRRQ
ncbi:related to nonphototropic hypocotyl protein 1 [Fusarium torulosum]|uniref:Related to nonphototropic hypocotyl protein 1 n=1 Tax=Fusarium torulosum TaxID=33205 RepID=A0AAE8MCU6_9HYPO|nr:related to nonphototropic hypocotyl protein 1 [Fusarium torulosum]